MIPASTTDFLKLSDTIIFCITHLLEHAEETEFSKQQKAEAKTPYVFLKQHMLGNGQFRVGSHLGHHLGLQKLSSSITQ